MADILDQIVAVKREEIAQAQKKRPLDVVRADAESRVLTRDFEGALRAKIAAGRAAVIAEIKKASPSKGVLRADFEPADIAQSYAEHGAACLSVLTDRQFFQGAVDYLKQARASCDLPVLRKDFLVDPYQVYESRVMGADCILLIAACLSDMQMAELEAIARQLDMAVLVEVHDRAELDRALAAGARVVGVNSRDLRTMTVDLGTAVSLASAIPDHVIAVAESGIRAPADVARLRDVGYDAFLVGEHLMAQDDPGAALAALIRGASPALPALPASRVAVKICGITTVEDGLLAAREGADAIGLVFWPDSRRAVDLATARAIAEALPPFIPRVGVFVNPTATEIERAVDAVGLDVVQLHGEETPEFCRGIERRVVKAVRVGAGFDARDALRFEGVAGGLLLDTRVDEASAGRGGTGRAFDWALAREVREKARYLVLAGGLTPENVGRAVASVRPDAVDVSSGVESSPGRKDPERVRAFVRAVRAAAP
jgi:indole-3-glycerol phosphate synthase